MDSFTISQMQQFSGIKAHTIRMWEKRFHGLSPHRSEGNTRYYNDLQLRRLLNIVSLMNAGYKVSRLCRMPDSRLFELLDEQLKVADSSDNFNEFYISQLIAGEMNFDEASFDKVLSNCIIRFGLKNTYRYVIYPMLVRIGLLWSKDSIPPAQEHFASNLIRQKLFTALDLIPPTGMDTNSWLLFLPENELHEIGLLLAHYLIRQSGHKSFYLGSDVPLDSVEKAVEQLAPDNILLFMVSKNDPESSRKYLDKLIPVTGRTRLFVAAREELNNQIRPINRVTFIHTVEQLEAQLEYKSK